MGVREEKKKTVDEIADILKESKSMILADYRGLNVADITELRKQLREAGVHFKVYKNTLARRATSDTDYTELDEHLVGPTAIASSKEDVVAPAKVIHNFSKKHEEIEIKGGILEGQVVSVDDIKSIASLPSQEGLLSMLCSALQGPIRSMALATKAVADQKEEQEA